MVDLNHPMMISSGDDTKADVMLMANAFRNASDDDTRKVMNVMTNQTAEALASLKFYAVTKSWFLRAWPILTAQNPDGIEDIGENLREYIGKIPNAELVESETVEPSPRNNDNEFKPSSICKVPINSETTKMKPGMLHTRDYFFLGPSAWMLVKEKFGYDGYELCRSCKTASGGIGQGVIEVALLPGEENLGLDDDEATKLLRSTKIPVSGRFKYEKLIPAGGVAKDPIAPSAPMATASGTEAKTQQLSWPDETAKETTQLESPILLLPPSTTSFQNETNDGYDPLGSSSEYSTMDVESEGRAENPTHISGRKRLASGLSNMGNTCFMNSTLQCLAHTESLRRYFLSGEYKKDLNRDNPLGTGGELATQFASLMGEMWSEPSKRRNVIGQTQSWKYNSSNSQAVYPRNFKNSLGKHAEQFMGYDQHDSQELATYLLDALHEDTNRVTKKPYVEKPEQGENESDADAADTAWEMHLRREDSRVLENFMGQVKSRLECCENQCDRVSTTFDPFMYLSVPIPGETERTMTVTFVPLNPEQRMQKLSLIVAKTATVSGLLETLNQELVRTRLASKPIPLEDLCPVEIYDKEIFKWHDYDDEVHGIKDFDKTFVYELRPLEEVRKAYSEGNSGQDDFDEWSKSLTSRVPLDLSSVTELNKGSRWKEELEKYSENRLLTCRLLNANRSSTEEKVEYYEKLLSFLDECYVELEREAPNESKGAADENFPSDEINVDMQSSAAGSEKVEDVTNKMIDCSFTPFPKVRTRYDVGVLEFCANKLRQFILDRMMVDEEKRHEGVVVQVGIRQSSASSMNFSTSRHGLLSTCLVLRLPSNMNVYELREHLAHRLSRSLIEGHVPEDPISDMQTGEPTTDLPDKPLRGSDSEKQTILRRTFLSYDNSDRRSSRLDSKVLGMLSEADFDSTADDGEYQQIADPSNAQEQEYVTRWVKHRGHVFLDLNQKDDTEVFDAREFDLAAVPADENGSSPKEAEPDITVLDCIQNYCKKEQLEDSEMWYCNKCKTHVRAWKQFHLYRTPPILIIHLKRFFFSATTHRRDKITRKVDFPLKGLDLSDLVADFGDDDKPVYDCYAVSNHFGGLGGGHYTAYTLSDDGTWCNYDDSRVTTDVDPKDVVSEAAYVLYYRRRDVPIGQDRDIVVDTNIASMVCEELGGHEEGSEISSHISAPEGEMDLIIGETDSNASSKTALSAMESIDNPDHRDHFAENDHPLQ